MPPALAGLKVGGPYDIELTVATTGAAAERVVVRDVLVGDVWIPVFA